MADPTPPDAAQDPPRYLTVDGWHEADGTPIVEDPADVLARRRFMEQWDRFDAMFDAMSPVQQQAYQALAAKRAKRGREATGTVEVVRRMPAARPAARRPHTSTTRSSARGSPDDDDDGPEPGDDAGHELGAWVANEVGRG